MKYIDNDKDKGIIYDWKKIRKEFKKLGVPDDVATPLECPLSSRRYFVELSERSIGKTTNWLLLGMVMNRIYGTTIEYIRTRDTMISPANLKTLFETIRKFGYIQKVTSDIWNEVEYRAGKWRYILVDDDGNIVKKDTKHFMSCLAINKSELYKSSYNSPSGDLIIFDEFIEKYYINDTFVYFCDIVKTIQRNRLSPLIVMLANTIDRESPFFDEMEIWAEIHAMRKGDHQLCTTERGTQIYVDIIKDKKASEKKSAINRIFYGFKNPKISAITGDDWVITPYPHPNFKQKKMIFNKYYIYIRENDILQCELCMTEGGIVCIVHPAKQYYDDSIIYTLGSCDDMRYVKGIGYRPMDHVLWDLLDRGRWFYSSNAVGTKIATYVYNATGRRI